MSGPDRVDASELLTNARDALQRREWRTARDAFAAARTHGPLDGDDLYSLGNCHWWLGDLDEAMPVLQDAYRVYLDEGATRSAALVALDTGYTYALRGEEAHASGWLSRASRLLEVEPPCAEQGFLVYLAFEESWSAHDLDAAWARAQEVHEVGARFAEPNLCALGVLGQGRVLVKQGRVAEGMALLDEAMVAAVSDDLDPGWAGNIYCHLMMACYELADWRRADEWTTAIARWCEAMPGAGPFLGICRVHRAQVLQAQGEWSVAEQEVLWVCAALADFHVEVVGEARYYLGDLHRQRGDDAAADAAFAEAHRLGRDPQPGRALLRLAQGRTATAVAEIRQALDAAGTDPLERARLLPAAVEIALATDDRAWARAVTHELGDIASVYATAGLEAKAHGAAGALALAEGSTGDALAALRATLACCRDARLPYDAALARLVLARTYEALGDEHAACLEREAAETELHRLGAAVPVAPGTGNRTGARPDGLTSREAEVLELVAGGLTNQAIADELVLSIRTVERHLATTYRKLGLSGRSARAAAVRHALTGGRPQHRER